MTVLEGTRSQREQGRPDGGSRRHFRCDFVRNSLEHAEAALAVDDESAGLGESLVVPPR
jgi:hypothetical protein